MVVGHRSGQRSTSVLMLALVALVAAGCGDYVGDDVRAGDYPRKDAVAFAETETLAGNAVVSPPDPEPVDPYRLAPGSCFEDLDEPPLRAFTLGQEVGLVACELPHRFEVYAHVAVEAEPDEQWPGDAAIDERTDMACLDAFEAFVEVAWEDSTLDYLYLSPTRDRWETGQRHGVCALFDLGLAPLEGSVAGSGL